MEEQSVQQNVPGKQPVVKSEAAPVEKDLSQQIERSVAREPLDQVKCVRVFGNYYRCNWWSRLNASKAKATDNQWGSSLMEIVRKSRFLSATMQGGELVVHEVRPGSVYHENRGEEAAAAK